MPDEVPPPAESVRAGHELRDVSVPLIVASALGLVLGGTVLLIALAQVSHNVVPEQKPGASPPTVMPGEAPVRDRIEAVPEPRLQPFDPRSVQRPEDLRADRQAALQSHAWIAQGTVARIPISSAMDAVVEAERAKAGAKKGGGK